MLPRGTEWFNHVHETQDELYFVHSGRAAFTVADETFTLEVGGVCHVTAAMTRIYRGCRAFTDGDTRPRVRALGWYLRSDVIWHKPNALPNSVKDRPVTDHEYVSLLAKSKRYHFGCRGDRRDRRQRSEARTTNGSGRSPTRPYKAAHFAVFPPTLVEPMLLSGCPVGGTVLDPFFGAGTTGVVAISHGRNVVGIELNPEYCKIAKPRLCAAV